MKYRIENRKNFVFSGEPRMMFDLYEYRSDTRAYIHLGKYSAGKHDASDEECIRAFEVTEAWFTEVQGDLLSN